MARPRWAGCCSGRRSAASAPRTSAGSAFVFVFCGVAAIVGRDRLVGLKVPRAGPGAGPRRDRRSRTTRRVPGPVPRPIVAADARARRAADGAAAPPEPGPDRGDHRQHRWRTSRAARTRSSGACSSRSLGAGLDLIGFTFAMFGLPILLLSPNAGRRWSTARGARRSSCSASIAPGDDGRSSTRSCRPAWAVPLILIEATGFAVPEPGAVRGGRRRSARRAGPRPPRACSARPGRSGSSPRR